MSFAPPALLETLLAERFDEYFYGGGFEREHQRIEWKRDKRRVDPKIETLLDLAARALVRSRLAAASLYLKGAEKFAFEEGWPPPLVERYRTLVGRLEKAKAHAVARV